MRGFQWEGSPELETLREMYRAGSTGQEIAQATGKRLAQVRNQILAEKANGLERVFSTNHQQAAATGLPETGDTWTVTDSGRTASVTTTTNEPVRSLADLCRVCQIDETVWRVKEWTANTWEAAAKDANGKLRAKTLYQVKARLERLAPLDNPALVLAAVEKGLARIITPRAAPRVWVKRSMRVLRNRIITDLHFGGHAWHRSTGGPSWNLEKAAETARASNAYLDAHENTDATETCLAFLGDLGHYETKGGATSNGTLLDIDSRADLMIQSVVEYALDTIAAEAERRPTTVYILEGNHSGMLDKTLRQAARYYFRKHKGVTVVDEYKPRQFLRWHANLLGYTHGDKAPRKLAELMSSEAADLWTGVRLKEFHTGHLHHEAARQKIHQVKDSLYEPAITHAGVVVRTHMAITPPDQYHADEGWIGAQQGMSDWYYHEAGAMIGSVIATPRVLETRKVTRAAA